MFGKTGSRQTFTSIISPDFGKQTRYSKLVAGDFFMHEGKLFLKLNLDESKEITPHHAPSYGTSIFNKDSIVNAVDVTITIR